MTARGTSTRGGSQGTGGGERGRGGGEGENPLPPVDGGRGFPWGSEQRRPGVGGLRCPWEKDDADAVDAPVDAVARVRNRWLNPP